MHRTRKVKSVPSRACLGCASPLNIIGRRSSISVPNNRVPGQGLKKKADLQKAVVAKSNVMEKAKAPKKMDETKNEFRLTKVL